MKYVLVNDLPTHLFLVNQGTLTFQPLLSRVTSLERPDFVLLNIDCGAASFAVGGWSATSWGARAAMRTAPARFARQKDNPLASLVSEPPPVTVATPTD